MSRTPMTMNRSGGLAAHLAAGVLAAEYPFGRVEAAVSAADKSSERVSKLTAETTVYCVIGMGLLMDVSTQEVINTISEGLARTKGSKPGAYARKAALSAARKRIGVEPLRLLWERGATPMASPGTLGAFWRGLRLTALDGSTLDVPDTKANLAHYGKPTSGKGAAAFPQLRLVGLVETGTHAFFAVATGPYSTSELKLAERVIPSLGPGMLCLADRFFGSFDLWTRASATGSHLLWRIRDDRIFPREKNLPDGSFLSTAYPSATDRKRRTNGAPVRIIEYTVTAGGRISAFRVMTTLLDHREAPAEELAALYPERWELEGAFDELKTHLRGGSVVLRSKTPELVEQEVYGLMLAHRAVRRLMHAAARKAGEDPDRMSFTHTVNVVRRKLASPPASSLSKGPANMARAHCRRSAAGAGLKQSRAIGAARTETQRERISAATRPRSGDPGDSSGDDNHE